MSIHFASIKLGFFICALLPLSVAAGFDEGLAAFNKKDYVTAIHEWMPLAQKGDVDAQFNIGTMHKNGQGVPKNQKNAHKWFKLSAEQGHTKSQFILGFMHATGEGAPKDYRESAKWYRMAAEKGHAGAQANLGIMYLGGKGVPQDYKEAVRWTGLSADQGDANSQFGLGVIYHFGRGVTENKVIAYALYNLSAFNDPSSQNSASELRTEIVRAMTPMEIEAGQTLTREMLKPGNVLNALDQYLKRQ